MKKSLCPIATFAAAFLFMICAASVGKAVDITLEDFAGVQTSQGMAFQPFTPQGTRGLRFTSETANLLTLSVRTTTASISQFDLRIYDPSTGMVLNTLSLSTASISQFNQMVTQTVRPVSCDTPGAGSPAGPGECFLDRFGFASVSTVFTLANFTGGTLPNNQVLALAITARFNGEDPRPSMGRPGSASITVSAVPEPATMSLLTLGLAGVAASLRKKRSNRQKQE